MIGYLIAFIVAFSGVALGKWLRTKWMYRSGANTAAPAVQPVYVPPLQEQEIAHLMNEINTHFQVWCGPAYWHKDTVIEFTGDHVRFSAINSTLTDFYAGWKFPYSRNIGGDPGFQRFRYEMADRTLAMLKANYPAAARDLYRDGGCLIFPTNGQFRF